MDAEADTTMTVSARAARRIAEILGAGAGWLEDAPMFTRSVLRGGPLLARGHPLAAAAPDGRAFSTISRSMIRARTTIW